MLVLPSLDAWVVWCGLPDFFDQAFAGCAQSSTDAPNRMRAPQKYTARSSNWERLVALGDLRTYCVVCISA
jgi:hypothetical protein